MVQQVRWLGGSINAPIESERIMCQIERNEIRVGPEAAREIAQRIEAQGGFWGPRSAKYDSARAKREAVIYDFHSTLTDVSSVLHLVKEKRYKDFYPASLRCPANENVVLAAQRSHKDGYANLLLTGMPEEYRDGLIAWLSAHGVPMDIVRMRPTDDFCKDFVLKERMYTELAPEYEVIEAWDDSPAVLDLWTSLGIPTVPMPRAVL